MAVVISMVIRSAGATEAIVVWPSLDPSATTNHTVAVLDHQPLNFGRSSLSSVMPWRAESPPAPRPHVGVVSPDGGRRNGADAGSSSVSTDPPRTTTRPLRVPSRLATGTIR